ncbi:DDHD domain-containing protein [Annulohypoxylon maeteangense]|uniref:DDHD domain-containing protein n=1 Tax=Annulohypoxylon maeteangense TaxID=1927788 RepID=UPI0020081F57|nr:DDHD domain-containing protein [Annulohypoxylon maeteangense]KAI0881795.1 DDHD domain-containing protein [Annulohypoxylon maeteangense]
MPPGNGDPAATSEKKETKKVEKSYLATAVDSINPWNISRSSTPAPKETASKPKPIASTVPTAAKKADDHSTNTFYGQSFKRYPLECPPLNVMWFHAVDVPKRKPNFLKTKKEDDTAKQTPPKKFVAFSKNDSRSIENAYQKLLEEAEDERDRSLGNGSIRSRSRRRRAVSSEEKANTAADKDDDNPRSSIRVPVNEDFLFDVDIEERELAPVYWLGPIYEIRRGSWFYQEGSTLRPCEENLAAQLEEGYLKIKPWTYPSPRLRSNSGMHDVTPKASSENLKATAKSQTDNSLKPQPAQPATPHQPQTYRLFGTYMNSIATYQDSNTAWLSSESVFSWVTSTVYQRFAGGGYMNGVKLVRGYSEPGKSKDGKDVKDGKRPPTPTTATLPPEKEDEKQEKALKRRSAPPSIRSDNVPDRDEEDDETTTEAQRRGNRLKRQFASFVETSEDPEKQEEQIRKREELEIQDDYNDQDGETQGREIEHLVLVTHGIGQLLGLRMESVNFVHDVNLLRKTIKAVYTHSADLKTLNKDGENDPGNCKIQVLPVCWRHLLDFPKRKKKGETDLGDVTADEDEYPSLEDITIEGVAFARSLISDLALDVLLYQSAYREQIAEIVSKESNRIYKLFMERNPEFKGKVHIIAHSLGSAIMFDILCRQKERPKPTEVALRSPLRFFTSQERLEPPRDPRDLAFDFDVENLFCLGSPIGLFQMLKGRTIGARSNPNALPSESPLNTEYVDDPFLSSTVGTDQHLSAITGLPFSVSSPKVGQLFNIFHPSDPISYRLEPLILPAMSSLKPQVLPYTKKGIFGAVAPQGLSGFGVKVGQSVSGLWSSFSAGIASNILNRSLGLTNQDVANFNANNNPSQPLPPGAGTNIVGGGVIDINAQSEKTDARKKALARQNSSSGSDGNSGTLIDDDLETLYSRFQKKRVEDHKNSASHAEEGKELGEAWAAEELKAQKLKREEAKVMALNRNGRVDYSIQESALDFNPINTIASHMAYWQDEDVSHFMISQMLAKRDEKRKADAQATVRI